VQKILLAATSAQDPDLISLLANHLPDSIEQIDLVGGTDMNDVEHRLGVIRQFVIAQRYDHLRTYPDGLKRYVDNGLAELAARA
jgi:hypothetical protein